MKYKINLLLIVTLFVVCNLNAQNLVYDIDSNAYQIVKIDGKEWITSNLTVSHYKNGDEIIEAKTEAEWKKCAEDKIGCWCYYQDYFYETDSSAEVSAQEKKEFGKLYNWYALNDKRGFGIEGYHVPSNNDWNSLVKYGSEGLRSETSWQLLGETIWAGCDCKNYDCNGNDSLGLDFKGSGYRSYIGIYDDFCSFYEKQNRAVFWTNFSVPNKTMEVTVSGVKFKIEVGAGVFGINGFEGEKYFWKADDVGYYAKGDGYSVRLIKDKN